MAGAFARLLVLVHKLMLGLLFLAAVCLGASKYYVMCQKAFAHFLQLVDSDQWDKEIAALRQSAKDAAKEAERRAAQKRLSGELDGGALPPRLDVVCAGGGFKAIYGCGVLLALYESDVSIVRMAGVMGTGQLDAGTRWGLAVASTLEKYPRVRPQPMWDFFYRRCALHTPVPKEGSLTMSITELSCLAPPRFSNRLISEFEGREAVGDALLATSALPWLLCRGLWMSWRGVRALDGGITNNVPYFRDGRRPQLVITYESLDAHFRGRANMVHWKSADMFEAMRRGVQDGASLLAGDRPVGLRLLSPEESVGIPPPPELGLPSLLAMAWRLFRPAPPGSS